jgi:hypothetical protein
MRRNTPRLTGGDLASTGRVVAFGADFAETDLVGGGSLSSSRDPSALVYVALTSISSLWETADFGDDDLDLADAVAVEVPPLVVFLATEVLDGEFNQALLAAEPEP